MKPIEENTSQQIRDNEESAVSHQNLRQTRDMGTQTLQEWNQPSEESRRTAGRGEPSERALSGDRDGVGEGGIP